MSQEYVVTNMSAVLVNHLKNIIISTITCGFSLIQHYCMEAMYIGGFCISNYRYDFVVIVLLD